MQRSQYVFMRKRRDEVCGNACPRTSRKISQMVVRTCDEAQILFLAHPRREAPRRAHLKGRAQLVLEYSPWVTPV